MTSSLKSTFQLNAQAPRNSIFTYIESMSFQSIYTPWNYHISSPKKKAIPNRKPIFQLFQPLDSSGAMFVLGGCNPLKLWRNIANTSAEALHLEVPQQVAEFLQLNFGLSEFPWSFGGSHS